MAFIVYGAGTPIRVETYHPEIAEAVVVNRYKVRIEDLVTVRDEDVVVLPGDSDT